MKHIAVLTSLPFESKLIKAELRPAERMRIAGRNIYKGKIFGKNILLMNCGIGKVNAALSTAAILENFEVSLILIAGIGGSYEGSGLKRGDIAVAAKEIYGDEGVAGPEGYLGLKEIGIPLVAKRGKKYFNHFPLKAKPAIKALAGHQPAAGLKTGNFVTVSSVSGSAGRALSLGKRFRAICENMEGAAAAHVCAVYGVEMLEVRGISNMAGIRDKREWNMKLASKNCQKSILRIIEKY
ncbi:MAG: futalosine hydrolase [Nitrospirae bacterium]|nr:futalosine hydrolase [Nitrospirota bacterium]